MIYFKFYVLLCFVFANLRAKIHLFFITDEIITFFIQLQIVNGKFQMLIMYYELCIMNYFSYLCSRICL